MIKLELSNEMVQVIGNALADAPFKHAAPVITEIQKQVNDQPKEVDGG